MTEPDRPLQQAFSFTNFDLRANRAGRLSARQRALMQASRRNVLIGFSVFALVMLGTVCFIAFMIVQSSEVEFANLLTDPDSLTTLGTVLGVTILVIGLGAVLTLRYTANLGAKQFSVARGLVEVASEAENNLQIRVGKTRLRVLTEDQLLAFRPGVEYQVYYVPGAVPLILSAGAADRAVEALPPLSPEEEAELARQDPQVQGVGRAWVVAVALGGMALCIPVAGVLASSLPDTLRCAVMAGLLVVAVAFVPLAIWFVSPRKAS